ncbi:MAG: PVC-type heme-binding CxxCH protein [Anditalea sp.]
MIVNKKFFRRIFLFSNFLLITSTVFAQNDLQDIPDPDPQSQLEMLQVADGFEVSLFAADPMVVKPIQMNWDAEGRLWVVSSTVYPHLKTGEEANDKIYVLEDTNGDGTADKSTVFAEGLLTPTGILPGDGGVYVANSTEILHFTDTDGDGKADQRRRVLSGFGTGDTHHLIHTFRWGPEGLFYFNQSIYIYSHVETPWGVKRLEGGGVWQLRPKTLELDVYAKGLINPWGLQFNRWGQSFLTDGAGNEGINYAFPGATFVTAPGAQRIIRGLNPGQPKHSGLEVISGRHLPESWAGGFITNDFRANRINRFTVEEQGSGYATKQVEDLLWTDNVAFRPVDISIGPDGAIYVADWYNPIIQHGEVDFHDPRRDQQHGRIWRIVAKNRPLVKAPKLVEANIEELLDALKMPEDWTRLQAKQLLKQRGSDAVIQALQEWIGDLDEENPDYEHHLLEALWVNQSLDVVDESLLFGLLSADNHNARAAAVRTLYHWYDRIDDSLTLLQDAATDNHPRVRLEAVIALRKLQTAEAASTALAVLDHQMDEFLDFALWQTIRELEPLWMASLKADPEFLGNSKKTVFALKSVSNPDAVGHLVQLYQKGEVPEEYRNDVLNSIAKWGNTGDLNTLLDLAVEGNSIYNNSRAAELGALQEAARQRGLKPDQGLSRIAGFVENDEEAVALSAVRLIGYWNMGELNGRLVTLARNGDKSMKKAALGALASMEDSKSHQLLIDMTSGNYPPELRLLAITELVSLNVSKAAGLTVEVLQNLPEQVDASGLFSAFLSRKEGTRALAEEISGKKIPESMAMLGRKTMQQQLPWYRHKDEDVILLKQAFEASGGNLPPERMPQQLSDQEINNLTQEIKTTADPELGEVIYRKTSLNCQTCHAIGGAGGLIGPDLSSLGTSSPMDDIIRSIVDPNESIKEGYELQRINKKDGSVVMGYPVREGASEVVLRNVAGQEVSIPKSQIDVHENVPGSLMPPGLTASLDREEFINLVGYLSRIGESGKFRVPNAQLVRRWSALTGNEELISKIREDGIDHIVKENTKMGIQPAYSKVSGDLPIEELPIIEVNPNQRYSFVNFEIEVLSTGNVDLSFNTTEGITAWSGQKPLDLTDEGTVVDLPQGVHQITLAIDRAVHEEGPLNIQIQDAETSPAQTRLVMGK